MNSVVISDNHGNPNFGFLNLISPTDKNDKEMS